MTAELDKVKQDESARASVPHSSAEGPRRSQRLQTDQSRLHTELEQCRAELLGRTAGEHGFEHCDKRVDYTSVLTASFRSQRWRR